MSEGLTASPHRELHLNIQIQVRFNKDILTSCGDDHTCSILTTLSFFFFVLNFTQLHLDEIEIKKKNGNKHVTIAFNYLQQILT